MKDCIVEQHESADVSGHRGHYAVEIRRAARVELTKRQLARTGHFTHLRQDRFIHGVCQIQNDADLRQIGHRLVEYFEPFCSQLRLEKCRSRDIGVRMREIRYNTRADSIPHHRNDNRNRGCGLLGGKSPRRTMRDNHINLAGNQLREKRGQPLIVSVRPAVLDDDIPSFLITEIAQAGAECFSAFGQTVRSCKPRNPTRKTLVPCCARASSGHAIVAPPRSVMNSRRLIRSLRRRG
jgi:hypothetical protein